MQKSKNTKRSLLASILAMMLCVAMLVCSTFAWFTDSVTSANNKIVAGNLDVELKYSTDGENWEDVNADTNMFDEKALWEPGYTEVVYLQVKNAGSLALKYQFGINVESKVLGKTADGEDIDLSNILKFGVVDTETAFDDRASARDAVKDNAVLVSAGYSSQEGHLAKDEVSNTIALVVYMPEEVGNEANYRDVQPQIKMGISLQATQDTVEADSFGKDYDANARFTSTWDGQTVDTSWYDQNKTEFTLDSAADLAGLAELINSETGGILLQGKTYKLDCNIDWNGNDWPCIGEDDYMKYFYGTFDGQNCVIKNANIKTDKLVAGLFGAVSGTIKDLEVKDVTIENTNNDTPNGKHSASGVVVGSLVDGSIENVKVTGNSSVSAVYRAGGIVGRISSRAKVMNCENHANVTSTSYAMYAGGIVGVVNSGGGQITNCINYGEISGKTDVGGIVGYAEKAVITDCTNNGNVKSDHNVGGILGFDSLNKGMPYASTITNCVNNGEITATQYRAGGILGTFATPGGSNNNPPTKEVYSNINNCINNGAVSGQISGTIFGYQNCTKLGDSPQYIKNLHVNITNCANTGTLNGASTTDFTLSPYVTVK